MSEDNGSGNKDLEELSWEDFDKVTLDVENIAGSMQLPQKANVFVSMCLDKNEKIVLNISKNRGGAVPQPIPLYFDKKCQQIYELADNPPE